MAPAAAASTSQGAPTGVGSVVPAQKSSARPGLWNLAAGDVAGASGARAVAPQAAGNDAGEVTNADNHPAHTRTNTVASGSNQTIISRLDSAVSQLPALPGIPGSFEGLSGIGRQNELEYVYFHFHFTFFN